MLPGRVLPGLVCGRVVLVSLPWLHPLDGSSRAKSGHQICWAGSSGPIHAHFPSPARLCSMILDSLFAWICTGFRLRSPGPGRVFPGPGGSQSHRALPGFVCAVHGFSRAGSCVRCCGPGRVEPWRTDFVNLACLSRFCRVCRAGSGCGHPVYIHMAVSILL